MQYFAIIRVFISSQEWAFEYCFGNKQQHAENMDVKKIVF